MDPTNPIFCREAAARCRKAAGRSTDPKEWITMAEQWEWLADTADGSWLLSSKGHPDSGQLLDLKRLPRLLPAVSSTNLASPRADSEM
jgi:hypothetical protein